MAVNSRASLIEYCKRKLGAPVIEINVDDDQVSDRVDEALDMYREYHDDAVVRVFLKHEVTATDLTNGYIPISSNVKFVKHMYPVKNGGGTGVGMWDIKYQMMLNDMAFIAGWSGGQGSLIDYTQMQMHLEMLNMQLTGNPQTNFTRNQDRLYVHGDFEDGGIEAGTYLVVEAYEFIDGDTYTQIWDDIWLKKYTTQLIKRQWGTNMSKFEGMQLPGGVTIDASKLYTEAEQEIEKLEEQLRSTYEAPIDFFVG